ncbi:MAG: hypothetical protein WAM91_11715 [Candidatus Acidiferrales bacterium]
MVKMIFQGSYWLGILSVVVSVVLRALAVAGIPLALRATVGYESFYKFALLMFVVAIASACYCMLENRKP